VREHGVCIAIDDFGVGYASLGVLRDIPADLVKIDGSFIAAYTRLYEMGWAHSVEVWRDGALAGGIYGVRIGGMFAGESMFHSVRDASKVALWELVDGLRLDGASLFDVQWTTPHLSSLGAIDISRSEYLERLRVAVGR